MIGLGAEVVDRDIFLDALAQALQKPSDLGNWHDFEWTYEKYNQE
jgi:leucyl/phenylalanyl-tRNA--protein transferase